MGRSISRLCTCSWEDSPGNIISDLDASIAEGVTLSDELIDAGILHQTRYVRKDFCEKVKLSPEQLALVLSRPEYSADLGGASVVNQAELLKSQTMLGLGRIERFQALRLAKKITKSLENPQDTSESTVKMRLLLGRDEPVADA